MKVFVRSVYRTRIRDSTALFDSSQTHPSCSFYKATVWWIWIGWSVGKLFIGRTCKKRADDLLKLDRHQLKLIAAILTGHASVRGHLCTIGLYDGDPSCRFCGLETQTVQHLVCCCEALSRQRYNVLRGLTIEPNFILCTATVKGRCLFISHTGLSKLCWIGLLGLHKKP